MVKMTEGMQQIQEIPRDLVVVPEEDTGWRAEEKNLSGDIL